jgi:hypothetical protein
VLGAGAIVSAAALDAWGTPALRLYFGALQPTATTAVVVALGLGALAYLERSRWFTIDTGRALPPGTARAVKWTAVLAIPVVLVDVWGGFGPDINVTVPRSLLFYPLMAVIAECVFHLVPLALGVVVLKKLLRSTAPQAPWALLGVVALLEPAFQTVWAVAESPLWANVYVGVHVLVFNLLSLWFFRRYDFLSVYVFRVSYYGFWHILWGQLRLELLFP